MDSRKMASLPPTINSSQEIPKELSHELWSFTNAVFFLVLFIGVMFGITFGTSQLMNIQHIKDDWSNQRCSPMIMPFAGLFGFNTKENFDFCMGKIFQMHSQPYLGSVGSSFAQFSSVLQTIFGSVNSLRNTIATLGGGINVVFQEFTDRITNFFFKLRLSSIHLKTLFMRMYAVLFSVMYMGVSGMTGMSSFTNTFLFSFLDTFCFPGETELIVEGKGKVPIKDIQIGDVLLPGNSKVTATFRFYSRGQAMVKLGSVTVSTNHYLMYHGKPIMAGEHPNAIHIGPWDSDDHLYCVNTSNHIIPVSYLSFLDYDETPSGDKETMNWINARLNAQPHKKKEYLFTEYGFGIGEYTKIKTINGLQYARDLKIGDKLTTGSEVIGVIRRQYTEYCLLPNDVQITPSTLYWTNDQWKRYGDAYPIHKGLYELLSFVVTPNSQLELEDGTHVRDYMELCSPDAETYYSKHLEA